MSVQWVGWLIGECLCDGFVLSSWRLSVLYSGRSIIAEKHDCDHHAKNPRKFQSDIIDQPLTDGPNLIPPAVEGFTHKSKN